jgi:hypothetical protein
MCKQVTIALSSLEPRVLGGSTLIIYLLPIRNQQLTTLSRILLSKVTRKIKENEKGQIDPAWQNT